MENGSQKRVVAYCPFKTFIASVEGLEHGIPNQIDKSLWPSFSGAIQSQLLTAFRFLGLIDGEDKPTKRLHDLVEKKDTRPQVLKEILGASYPELVALDLMKTTPNQFEEAIRGYGMTGDTNIKAKSFFLRAAKYASLPVSPLLTKITRQSGPRRRKAAQPFVSIEPTSNGDPAHMPPTGSRNSPGTTRTVELKSGGRLTISLSVDVFLISQEDREFVFGLIDKLNAYDRAEKNGERG